MNKVILTGRIGQDPETKEFSDGGKLVSISLATSEKWKNAKGEIQEHTDWHRVVFSGKIADNIERYCHKGDQITVIGKVKYRSYEKDGQTVYITEIRGAEAEFLQKASTNTGQQENVSQSANTNGF